MLCLRSLEVHSVSTNRCESIFGCGASLLYTHSVAKLLSLEAT